MCTTQPRPQHGKPSSLHIKVEGIWTLKWSLLGLTATAVFQFVVVLYSGSVVLLGDTIYNFGDTLTAIPLWIASLIMAHIHLPDGNF